jgi:hypothetical protein
MDEVIFPSGSNWGLTQLQALRFSSQPEVHPLKDLQLGIVQSKDSLEVLEKLKQGFGLERAEWIDGGMGNSFDLFYEHLREMLPRIQNKYSTPKIPTLRSNTHLPSSSTQPSASPWSGSKTMPLPTRGTPSKSKFQTEAITGDNSGSQPESDEDILPTPMPNKRQREDSSSPSLPQKTARRATNSADGPVSFLDMHLRSSQTDSTFPSSDHTTSDSEDQISDGDRPETDVTVLMQSLLTRIREQHGDRNGYSFSASNDVETLSIPICGSFPRSKPDLLIRMHRGGKTYPIADVEVCDVSALPVVR